MALPARVRVEPDWDPTAGVLHFRRRLRSSPSPLCFCGSEANPYKAQSSRGAECSKVSSLAGSGMEHKSCDCWLLAELLHVQFCFCQSRVTHMLHAGLWPDPLKWFMAVLILCTFSGRHKSASCWFYFVGLFVFFTRSCFTGTFGPPQQRFLFMQRMDGDRRCRVRRVLYFLSLNMLHYVMFLCLTHPAVETHTRPLETPAEL